MKTAALLLAFATGLAVLAVPPASAAKKSRKSAADAPRSERNSVNGTKCFWVYNGSPSGPGKWCSCGSGRCGPG